MRCYDQRITSKEALYEPDSCERRLLIWSAIFALTALGFWAEANTRLGRTITGIMVAMMGAMLLSNLRVLPFEANVYDSIFRNILPVAIPLMLFRADLLAAFRNGGATVGAFCLGAAGIVAGAFVASWLLPVGEATAVAAGMYTATYTGGSVNFSAMAIAADFNDPTVLTPMIAADIVATNLQTMVLIAMPGIAVVRAWFGYAMPADVEVTQATAAAATAPGPIDLFGAAFAVSVAMLLVYLGAAAADWLGRPALGIVITTVLALLVSNLMKPVVRLMAHDFEIGLVAIFLFLVALAAGADVSALVNTGLQFFMFAILILAVHLLVLAVGGRLLGLDLRSIVIGSTACVGGVTTATAIASAKGWRDLLIPGILASTVGNAVGTLLGVSVWSVLT